MAVGELGAARAAKMYRSVKYAAIVLLLGDAVLVVLHGLHSYTTLLDSAMFSLELEGGYPEYFQYTKEAVIAACLVAASVRARSWIYLGWAAVFALLLVDDATQGHERLGRAIAEYGRWSGAAGLRPDDFGEIAMAGLAGSMVLVFSGLALWRGSPPARQATRDLLCLMALLAFFGVCVDALHVIALYRLPRLSTELGVVEDGGEMVVMSATAIYVLALAMRSGIPAFDLWGWISKRSGS